MDKCGPFICPYPDPVNYRWRQHWTCLDCGTKYFRGRKIRDRSWRRSFAPYGSWCYRWWTFSAPPLGTRYKNEPCTHDRDARCTLPHLWLDGDGPGITRDY